ncbi:MAG TPA: hypothetical protein VFE78_05575, partial [Gemmataceae bacterium]|nr:hypothetical protein [Gemmataceae bacterium]
LERSEPSNRTAADGRRESVEGVILLPLRFNDGQPVPDGLIADTWLELEQRFGAVSSETQTIPGLWRHADPQGSG